MKVDLKNIAPLVERQFPAFYREDGETFLQFVKAYYEWMDEIGPLHKARRLPEYDDIDTTEEAYVEYFMKKYMHGIPRAILSDKRLLQKHILDLYRSKGSVENLKLLFRLLYKEEIDLYLPQVDVLKTSDGKWVRRQYLEVAPSSKHFTYQHKFITGSTTGATAFVSEATKLNTGTHTAYVLYLTDVLPGPTGETFRINEYVYYDGLPITEADLILGSAVGAAVVSSSEYNSIGDELHSSDPTGRNIKFNVSKTIDSNLNRGYITFKIIDGGEGYTLDSVVTVTRLSATTGTGASFRVGSLSNTSVIAYNDNMIAPMVGVQISAGDYGADLNYANILTILDDALRFENITVGTIATLAGTTSGDRNYNGSVSVNVYESRTVGYGYIGNNGGLWGNNAVISGTLSAGNGVIQEVRLISSGYGYNNQGEELMFINQSNTNLESYLSINIGPIGLEEGGWLDESGFLNSSKYLHDSFYYQEYSYEIQAAKSLDKYIDIVKQVAHPVGNRMFGKPMIIDSSEMNFQLVDETIIVS